jgi:hypothetical protein
MFDRDILALDIARLTDTPAQAAKEAKAVLDAGDVQLDGAMEIGASRNANASE